MYKYYLSIGILTVFVIVLVIYGIMQSGGPISAKNIKLDEERLNNFSDISYEIDEYYYSERKLPRDLQTLSENSSYTRDLKLNDPENKKPYEYKKVSEKSYNLCTAFSTDSDEVSKKFKSYDYYDEYGYSKDKKHPKGYHCINYKVDDYGEDYYDDYDYPEDEYDDIDSMSSDNKQRRSDITQILNAIGAYSADNIDTLPTAISSKSAEISDIGADICEDLVPDYIPELPVDPSIGEFGVDDCSEVYDTGYYVSKDSTDRVTVSAPFADEDEKITISR